MARAGMLQRSGKNGSDSTSCSDEVARSLELLDRVLSEFEEPAPTPPPQPPDHGHQSEDDGYMSMNGRRAKFALGFRPTVEQEEVVGDPSPPPPEEAQRIISNLLPMVSPPHSSKRSSPKKAKAPPPPTPQTAEDELCSLISINGISSTKQTTFPKTRHQRPYGWDRDTYENGNEEIQNYESDNPSCRFSSLQGNKQKTYTPPNWLPARQGRLDRLTTEKLLTKKSPSLDNPPSLAFMGFTSDLASNKPYNEHPVTIYPGPNVQYNKQGSSPYNIPKYNNKNVHSALESSKKTNKMESRADGELISPNNRIPPRTLAGSMERHRDVRRSSTEDVCYKDNHKEEEHFSDDSLEENLPPPPAINSPNKRNSIAWEVSLDDDPLLTPGSTKVIGRRRRKSGENTYSSSNSIPRSDDSQLVDDELNGDYWPPPPLNCSTEEDLVSPFSDTDNEHQRLPPDMKTTGTYVIRRSKYRKEIPAFNKNLQKEVNKSKYDDIPKKSNKMAPENIINKSPKVNSLPKGQYFGSPISSRDVNSLHTPKSRHSVDLNVSRISHELNTPKSRYSIDLCSPNPRMLKEISCPKSRLSLDLNKTSESLRITEKFEISPKNGKRNTKMDANNIVQQKEYNKKHSPQGKFRDFKKYSSTFDNIKSLIKEGVVENCPSPEIEETVAEINTTTPVRVVSLPSLAVEDATSRPALITTVEEEEDPEREDSSPLRKIESNISAILNRDRRAPYSPKDWKVQRDEFENDVSEEHVIEGEIFYGTRERVSKRDVQKSASHGEIPTQRSIDRRERSFSRKGPGVQKSTSAKDVQGSLNRQPSSSDSAVSSVGDFPVNVHIVEHSFRPYNSSPGADLGPLPQTPESPSFPPLPPSPVPEDDDEYSEILHPPEIIHTSKHNVVVTPELRHRSSEPPIIPTHRDSNSLKSRSMEPNYNKNKRNSNFKSGSTDRRTLPTGGPHTMISHNFTETTPFVMSNSKRRTFGRSPRTLQTSASLPETPIFSRGVDIARTPMRTNPPPRLSSTLSSIQPGGASSTISGYGRGCTSEQVLTGADLLRMAGGPGRGWYPRNKNRPASNEHLDHIMGRGKSVSEHHVAWDGTGSRKPLTLPPNITPKFFQRSPREALRRVTSLLIRKGNTKEKESRQKETTSPAARSANGDELPGQKPKKGFFRSLWKRSRHYSLEHP